MSKHKEIFASAFAALIVTAFLLTGFVNAQATLPIVRVKSDGTIEPSSVAIQRNGNTYIFTGDVYAQTISIAKEGIVIDGAGYTLIGPYDGSPTKWIIGEGPNQEPTNETFSMGIDTVTNTISGLTIKNLNIKNFSIGMYLWTPNNMVTGNAITYGIVGILLSGNDNNITGNYIADNKNGVYFGSNQPGNIPTGVILSDNCFINNLMQLSGCVCEEFNTTEEIHTWDNGRRGNFWSDYNGTDANGDGLGDTPYEIDLLNVDRYPLMQMSAVPPKPTATASSQLSWLTPETWMYILILAAAIVVAVVVATAVLLRKRKQPQT